MRISLRGTGDGVRVNFRLEINRRRWIALLTMLGVLTAIGLYSGLWAVVAPESFYNSFPGFGLHWVRADGPYNHHLAGDVGAFFLALAAISGAALYYRDSVIARVSGFGWLVFGVPHAIYHAFHRPETIGGFEFTLELLAVLLIPALGLAILLVAPRERFPVPEPAPFTLRFPRREPPRR
ncbi:hypothetical protein VMT65_29520 [Nocardia sp. CDC153]|uniref:hypothetical protein n=1 Tax=Nocardia sp. CDC153 TaxID=3112167 RepID=UPI002DB60C1C|nr:hypothetical protein [Nocardia sp. CDC153]MEC3957205.1 hypothetical protein [Nocardia sp. CDC153]